MEVAATSPRALGMDQHRLESALVMLGMNQQMGQIACHTLHIDAFAMLR